MSGWWWFANKHRGWTWVSQIATLTNHRGIGLSVEEVIQRSVLDWKTTEHTSEDVPLKVNLGAQDNWKIWSNWAKKKLHFCSFCSNEKEKTDHFYKKIIMIIRVTFFDLLFWYFGQCNNSKLCHKPTLPVLMMQTPVLHIRVKENALTRYKHSLHLTHKMTGQEM